MSSKTSSDAATDATHFPVGSLVRIVGLQNKPELNGQLGVISTFHKDKGRFEVVPSRGRGTLAIKPSNLTHDNIITPSDAAFRQERKHTHVAFWPQVNDKIPVQCIPDWPQDDASNDEIPLLKRTFGWKNPKILGGVTSEGNAKPDFVMYFDADDNISPLNRVAQAIADLLPHYELSKVKEAREKKPFRGVCVLLYCPMTMTTFSSGSFGSGFPRDGTQMMSGNPSRKFSLQQLQEVLQFHLTLQARSRYKAHDNPMHRVFGGMLG